MTDLHLHFDRTAGRLSDQIAAELRAAIRAGRLVAGTRLPSSRDLAQELIVSRGVVVTAYEQLIAEGFLIAHRGEGTRVAPLATPDRPAARSRSPWPEPDPDLPYDLRLGPDLAAFPRDRWLAATRHVLRTIPNDDLAYPDPAGATGLRTELAGYLGRVRAANVPPDRIVVTNGVAHGLAIVARLLAEDGHAVLAVEDPASARQLPLLRASGLDLVPVPVDADGIDVAALARTRARAVLVTPAHQYPTGVVLSPDRRSALIGWARDVDGLVIEDDYDAEFRYDRDPIGCLQGIDPDRVALTGSVSKSLAPALRLGWVAAPAALAERVRDYRARTDLGAQVIDQHVLAQLIGSGAYDRHLRVMRRRYRARRDLLAGALRTHLPGAVVRGVSAGLHLYVELPPGHGEEDVVAAAARRGVAVEGAAELWSAAPPRPALVLGYGRLAGGMLVEAVVRLAMALSETLLLPPAGDGRRLEPAGGEQDDQREYRRHDERDAQPVLRVGRRDRADHCGAGHESDVVEDVHPRHRDAEAGRIDLARGGERHRRHDAQPETGHREGPDGHHRVRRRDHADQSNESDDGAGPYDLGGAEAAHAEVREGAAGHHRDLVRHVGQRGDGR
jgi:GntR family transcriptional regulator/MocR family aminotransferase